MTCIVGLVDKSGRGYIAGDSVGSNGHTKGPYRNAKVFRLVGWTTLVTAHIVQFTDNGFTAQHPLRDSTNAPALTQLAAPPRTRLAAT
jgi:hypothetical protein